MNKLESQFFDEYKNVDNICMDRFHSGTEISEYISLMENEHSIYKMYVDSWELDFKNLKHLRWVRNKLAHEANSSDICTNEDYAHICDFHNRILKHQDSLAKLRKIKINHKKTKPKANNNQVYKQNPKAVKTRSNKVTNIFLWIFFAILITMLIYSQIK